MQIPYIGLRSATVLGLLVWTGFAAMLAVASLPYNPLSPGLGIERTSRSLLPEGWGFFTRDAREADIMLAYRQAPRAWRWEPPQADVRNLFGLLRKSRVLPYESRRIVNSTGASFSRCKSNLVSCLEQAVVHRVSGNRARPFLCGDIALVRRAPVPSAWLGLVSAQEMPTDVIRARVECNHARS